VPLINIDVESGAEDDAGRHGRKCIFKEPPFSSGNERLLRRNLRPQDAPALIWL
jgi:hypothetical protein